jgi:WXXGXW repeat (2 copies)
MNSFRFSKVLFLIATASLLTAGCTIRVQAPYNPPPPVGVDVSVGGGVYVNSAPPPPIQETMTIAPDPSFVWIGGSWVWGNARWRWEGGHWARPPHPGAVWVPHRYAYRNGHHVWVRGGWK